MGQEARVDLGHPREQPLLVVRERVPRSRGVHRRERLAVRSGARLGRPDRVDLRQLGLGRDEAHRLLAGERRLAHGLVAHVELALVPVGPLLRGVVGRVGRAGRVVQEERLVGRDGLRVHDELDGLVGDVLAEVVALVGRLRLVHRVVVVDQLREPLAGLGAEEPVEALEAATRRPVAPRRGQVHLDRRAQVPLADHVGVPAALAEDLGQHPVLGRDRPAGVGEPAGALGDAGHAVAGVVAAGQQAGPRRRAQGRRVPLRVAHAVGRDLVDVRRRDRAAVAAHRREPDVVEHDVDHVRCARQAPPAPRTAPSPRPSRGCRC